MQEFQDKVAVVTGAASGIGRALAGRCAQAGMKVVLADVDAAALQQAEHELRDQGATVLAVQTDVSRFEQVQALADRTIASFGAVHLLFNNAGVGAGTTVWESSAADWEWVVGVNLWGTVYGVRVFVPLMLKQDADCHIVNTASMAGLIPGPGLGIYRVTKAGVISLSETLYLELQQQKARIGVSVLCPGWVKTRIMEAERNRPAELRNASAAVTPGQQQLFEGVRRAVDQGLPPEQVAEQVLEAIREQHFYILTHPDWKPFIRTHMMDILEDRSPT